MYFSQGSDSVMLKVMVDRDREMMAGRHSYTQTEDEHIPDRAELW